MFKEGEQRISETELLVNFGAADYRLQFLMKMYEQLWSTVNQHVRTAWDSLAALVTAFAVLSYVDKQVISLDIATAVIVAISIWSAANILHASHWYNQNNLIIANIEKLFLGPEAKRQIHPYIGIHRKPGSLTDHLEIQLLASIGLGVFALASHFLNRVVPGIGASWNTFEPLRCLPYVVAIAGTVLLVVQRRKFLEVETHLASQSSGPLLGESGLGDSLYIPSQK